MQACTDAGQEVCSEADRDRTKQRARADTVELDGIETQCMLVGLEARSGADQDRTHQRVHAEAGEP